MSRTTKILWIAVALLVGLGFVVAGRPSLLEKIRALFPAASPTPIPLPSGALEEIYTVDYTAREIAAMEEAFRSGKETWRSDAVAVVRHELPRLGIAAGDGVEVREHGEYRYTPARERQTLIFVMQPFRDVNAQTVVLVEEHTLGFWIPQSMGPFYKMIDQVGK
ncbi:MAG: hypothetical protein Q8R13_00555 [bacterium]|nr:hypothetical protein [bacterium]